jgi:hypothetical protein
MSLKSLKLALCVSAFTLAAACGSDDPVNTTPYDFTATVRTGPSAGTELHGDLMLIQTSDPNHANGIMYVPASGTTPEQSIPTSANKVGSTIDLTFTMPDGRLIKGTGPFTGDFTTGQGTINGALTGPGTGDGGDWAGKLRPCTPFQRERCTEGFYKCTKTKSVMCSAVSIAAGFGDLLANGNIVCRACIESVLVIPECRCAL